MTQKIVLTRGLPGAGKSTYVKDILAIANDTAIRVERDLLRDQLFGTRVGLTSGQEKTISSIQFAMAEVAIRQSKSVYVSDTNLRASVVKQWAKFAADKKIAFETVTFDNLTLDELIKRDQQRRESVGEEVIRILWKKFTKNGKISPVVFTDTVAEQAIQVYIADTTKPKAIIVDIDGTLAKMADRSPYEWNRVGEDTPIPAVVNAVRAAIKADYEILFTSGRDASCRNITLAWLESNVYGDITKLFMRPEGDMRKDNVVKLELFDTYIRNNYNVEYVLDDRDQVVAMWRSIGLPTFQVAPGAF